MASPRQSARPIVRIVRVYGESKFRAQRSRGLRDLGACPTRKLVWWRLGVLGKVCTPRGRERTPPGSRMIQHLTAMWKFRHFLFALVKLDLRLRYRRSVLGVGWSLLNPIAMTIVFTVVFSNLLGGGDPIAYAASVLTGMAVWSFLRDSTLNGCRCFHA